MNVYEAVIDDLMTQLQACLDVCREAKGDALALDVCLTDVLAGLRHVATTYAGLWASLEIPWFDHRFDWLRGPTWWSWYERGICAMEHITPESEVLDLCCGDGFYAGMFYGKVAKLVHGVDRNEQAIALARRCYGADNVQFFCRDVRDGWPQDRYDVVTCMGAIEHFSVTDSRRLLERIKAALPEGGAFIGSTVLMDEAMRSLPGLGNPEHDNEFESVEQLRRFLSTYFEDVRTWVSSWGSRQDIYFRCGDF